MPRFTEKTVIITGAAGALGVGVVRRFAAEDAGVVIGARQREQVADLLDELGGDRAVFARLDVTTEQDWTAAVATAEAAFGPVSVLVNNAARAIVGTTMSLPPRRFPGGDRHQPRRHLPGDAGGRAVDAPTRRWLHRQHQLHRRDRRHR